MPEEANPFGSESTDFDAKVYSEEATPTGDEAVAQTTEDTQDGAATEAVSEEAADVTTDTSTEEGTATEAEATPSEDDGELDAVAARMKLDLSNEDQRKTAESFLNNQKYTEQLKAELESLKQGATKEEQSEAEGELFKQYEEEQTEEAPREEPTPQDTQTPLWQQWKSPQDAVNATQEAWKSGDPQKIIEVGNAEFQARLSGSLPLIQRIAQDVAAQMVNERFGDFLPDIEATVHQRRNGQAEQWATETLAKSNPDFGDIFNADANADPVIGVDGNSYPNSPVNRILAENPWIMQITVDKAPNGKALNPQDAMKATYLGRYKAVHQIHTRGKVTGTRAKEFVKAGAEMQKRSAADKTRKTLNKGTGGRAEANQQEDYVTQLTGRGGTRLGDLIKD